MEAYVEVITSPLIICYYTYLTYVTISWYAPVSVYLFFFIGYGISKFIMSPLSKFVSRQEKLEGNFRYMHLRIRENSESIAIYRGANKELNTVNDQFTKTMVFCLFGPYRSVISLILSLYSGCFFVLSF